MAAIARDVRTCIPETTERIQAAVSVYGPLPLLSVTTEAVTARLASDKKTVAGAIHFVLPEKIGKVKIVSDVPPEVVHSAIEQIRNHA